MVDVFISYRRAQRDMVEPIRSWLEALGLKVFFDISGIDGGADFPTVIDENLRTSKSILACWSSLYFERRPAPDWCMIECRFGLRKGTLVPVAVERFAEDAPPVDMHTPNYFDLSDWRGQDQHEGWQLTLRSLSRQVGRELAGAVAAPIPRVGLRSEAVRLSADKAAREFTQSVVDAVLANANQSTSARLSSLDDLLRLGDVEDRLRALVNYAARQRLDVLNFPLHPVKDSKA